MDRKQAEDRLIDWLLVNIDKIKMVLQEMKDVGSTVVYSDCPNIELITDRTERKIVYVDEALKIVEIVISTIKRICTNDDLFDVFTAIYFDGKRLKDAMTECQMSSMQVRYRRKQIRDSVKENLGDADIEIEDVLDLKIASKIGLKEAS
jgi:hypothetical protein